MYLIFWFVLICIVVFMFECDISRKIGVTVMKYSKRYDMHMMGVEDKIIIHPKCLIDEYAKIVRRLVWFSPIIPPTVVPVIAIRVVCFGNDLEIYENDRRIRGAIFCHVERIKQFIHDRDVITEGNHKWHGAAPSFSNSDVIRMMVARFLSIKALIIIDDPSSRSIDPSA